MLLRMYLYFFERRGWDVSEIDRQYGEQAGIKSVTLHVKGEYAFGYLRAEAGVHRLVRPSPFNAQGKRQTSFAAVNVVPEFDEADGERRHPRRRTWTSSPSSAPAGPAGRTSTRSPPPSASPTSRPASPSPARSSAASSRTSGWR